MFQQTEEADSLSNLDGYFICENPSKNLDSFRGALYITEQTCVKVLHLDPTVSYTYGNGEHQNMIFTSVDMDNMLLRGSVIKNSGWAAGMVVFTGVNTKLSLNLCDSTFKFSNVEKKLNRYVYVIFGLWLLMAIVCSACTRHCVVLYHCWWHLLLQPLHHQSRYFPSQWRCGCHLRLLHLLHLVFFLCANVSVRWPGVQSMDAGLLYEGICSVSS